MRKILISLLVFLVALAVVVAPVGAKDGGPLAVAVDEMDIEVSNFNFGLVGNNIFAVVDTGWNRTFGYGADVDTGNATVGATVGNSMNSNTTTGMITDAEWGPFAVNFGFGDYEVDEEGSTECIGCPRPPRCEFPMPCWMRMALWYWHRTGNPVAIAWDNTEIDVHNFNLGFVSNNLMLLANTGHNLTVGSKVDTGNASITANVGTTLNTNTTGISMYEGGIGPVAVNFEMDGGSAPLAIAVETDKISVSNFNLGVVGNNIFAVADTGWNKTYGRGADVDTGNAAITSNISNAVNTNTTSVAKTDMAVGPVAVNADLGGMCGLDGIPCLPAGGVGPVAANIGTSGIAVAVESDSIEVSNDNMAIVTNNEVLLANTGHNDTGCPVPTCPPRPPCQGPCGGEAGAEVVPPPATTVDTGDAAVTTTVTNTVNTNSTTITVSE